MEIKKSPKADLEKQRVIFIEIGLVLALSLILFAFEWTSSKGSAGDLGQLSNVDSEEEIIPITRQEEVKPPPPPPPPQVTEVLNIVEDDVEIEEELEIEETEADEETEVEIIEVADEEEEAEIFHIVEDMPQFPGGDIELRKYIATKVVYPQIARETGIEGKVYVSFVVNSKGAVTKVQLVRGVDPLLDKEALKVIEGLPKWTPGKQRGKPVNVSFTVPITFKLG
ncbi:MAG: energy transducer TonB [Bacteroidetes bacterium]|jgi:periplasmic protein TonB|nr:energy transducer TonB [Bacteroidota bacterium]MBT6687351.1 energy transducer TonB [Bacteroidota bacterium]MBT7144615.1 energy transducer TonB [Bacteroidota bacterium]MBT7490411.1 energy transducer TonB [Bacteroidota bacterium]